MPTKPKPRPKPSAETRPAAKADPPSPVLHVPPITFEGFEEFPDQLAIAKKLAARHLAAVPTWVHEIAIERFERADDNNSIATVHAQADYRRMLVCVWPAFWTQAPASQDKIIRHEFAHALLAPMTDIAEEVIGKLGQEARGILEPLFEKSVESVTQDICFALATLQQPGPERIAPTIRAKRTGKS